ncbi:MAG: 5'-nucleotidase C-terminal domain-containing protein, partial [Hyphomicrobiaceae bacterium]
ATYRLNFTGQLIKNILEDVADNLFNKDPYYQQGGDMVRVGGMSFVMNVDDTIGRRIDDMRLLRTGEPIDLQREYVVSGWASVNENTEGPAIWDVVGRYIKHKKVIRVPENNNIKVVRG